VTTKPTNKTKISTSSEVGWNKNMTQQTSVGSSGKRLNEADECPKEQLVGG